MFPPTPWLRLFNGRKLLYTFATLGVVSRSDQMLLEELSTRDSNGS